MTHRLFIPRSLVSIFFGLVMLTASGGILNTSHAAGMNPCAANPCAANPCAANPCAANPCAANPCAANPCAANPCAANPCAANPCAVANPCAAAAIKRPANYQPHVGNKTDLAKSGKKLFNDTKLSSNGMSCATCHDGGSMFEDSFLKPYPHSVQMAGDRFAIQTIHLDEMVQLCMVVPMATEPLSWESKELASLVAYVKDVQKDFIKEEAGE